ncbi:MAG: 2-iminoacetate synthase ThiH, partial [Clostridiales bacterium]|nr:2-iminoacetate synthase ThiH [Clostridiales bacterium]
MDKIDHMKYLPDMEILPDSDIQDRVIDAMHHFDYQEYSASDVMRALRKESLSLHDFGALLSPAAEPFLELIAERATKETQKHFGNSVLLFTPLYISNYC